MSIKDIQINRAIDKITKEKLKNGSIPQEHTISYLLNQYFKDNIPGTPTMNFREVDTPQAMKKREIAKSADYNAMLDEIEEDLSVLYKAIMEYNQETVENFIYYENERAKIVRDLKNYSNHINNILTISQGANKYYDIKTENFTDFTTIDMEATDALIDLNNSVVTLSPEINRSDKVPLFDADISVIDVSPADYVEREKLTNINNCIDDYINDAWVEKLHISDIEEVQNVSITIQLDFEEPIRFSQLEITSKDHLNKKAVVQYKDNDWQIIDTGLQPDEFSDYNLWCFNPITTDSIRITISESINSEDHKGYSIFTINDISMYYSYFQKEGKVKTTNYSIDHRIASTFDNVSIEPEHIIPKSGDIDYYLEFYDNDDNLLKINGIERHEAKPEEPVELDTTEINREDYSYEDISRENDYDAYNINFYSIDRGLEDSTIDKEFKLFKGIDQWHKTCYQKHVRLDEGIGLSDFNNPPAEERNIINDYTDSMSKYIREYFTNDDINLTNTVYINSDEVSSMSDIEDYIKVRYLDGGSEGSIDNSDYEIEYYREGEGYETIDENIEGTRFPDCRITLTDDSIDNYDVVYVKYLAPEMRFLFTTYIYSEKPQSYISPLFKVPEAVDNGYEHHTHLYVNKSRARKYDGSTYENRVLNSRREDRTDRAEDYSDIPENSYYYDINLNEGWNKVMYVAYTTENIEDTFYEDNFFEEIETDKTQEDIDLIEITEDDSTEYDNLDTVRCRSYRGKKDKLIYRSLYDLQNKVISGENDYFTIDSNNLIVNTPVLCNYHGEYLTEVEEIDYVSVEAILKTNNKYITPRLNKIDIDFFH